MEEGESMLQWRVLGCRSSGRAGWNRIEIQGLDDADGQGFDWFRIVHQVLANLMDHAGTSLLCMSNNTDVIKPQEHTED